MKLSCLVSMGAHLADDTIEGHDAVFLPPLKVTEMIFFVSFKMLCPIKTFRLLISEGNDFFQYD